MKALTAKERAFVSHYHGKASGNGAKAAELAGYAKKSARITASQLLTKPNIRKALEDLADKRDQRTIATAEERDIALTEILRSTRYKPLTRIRAIQEMNKVEGRHVARHEIAGRITLEMALAASREGEE